MPAMCHRKTLALHYNLISEGQKPPEQYYSVIVGVKKMNLSSFFDQLIIK